MEEKSNKRSLTSILKSGVKRINYKEVINSTVLRSLVVYTTNHNEGISEGLMAVLREGEVRIPLIILTAGVTEAFKETKGKLSYVYAALSATAISAPIEYLAHANLHGGTENLHITMGALIITSLCTTPIHLKLYKKGIYNMTGERKGYFRDNINIGKMGWNALKDSIEKIKKIEYSDITSKLGYNSKT